MFGVIQTEAYHPNKSRVGEDALSDFLRAKLTGDLNEVLKILHLNMNFI